MLRRPLVSIVINYCTADERFIRICLDNALKVSDDVIVPISDHLYDGTPENIDSIQALTREYPAVKFQLYQWTTDFFPRYWHNMSRIVGSRLVRSDSEWVLFLDSDEILEPDLLNQYLFSGRLDDYSSYKLNCYWYFREPIYQATTTESSPVLIRKELISINPYDRHCEREQLFEYLSVKKLFGLTVNNQPLAHHYSWVRTKEQMIKKVSTWGHADDKDWKTLIEEEFSRSFNGTDFVHGYRYNIVDNKHNL